MGVKEEGGSGGEVPLVSAQVFRLPKWPFVGLFLTRPNPFRLSAVIQRIAVSESERWEGLGEM